MDDLISRADAIRLLVDKYKFTTSEATEILSEIPSAEAVSREEHVKELNDLAVSWKKRVDELEHLSIEDRIRIMYDAKEDVHNVRIIDGKTSAEAVQVVRCKDCKFKRLYDEGDTKVLLLCP